MRQSNTYIIMFMLITTIVIGGVLSGASQFLRPAQLRSIELDTRTQILGAVMPLEKGMDILNIYGNRIESIVVNSQGEVLETDADGNPLVAENVDIARQFRVRPEERLLPVFIFKEEGSNEVQAYIFPVYGVGLWDNIWGYIALETDLETIRGVRFDHAGETPGLGARITDIVVQERFIGRKIYDDLGQFISVQMLRSERNPEDRLDDHHVDGMAGATITGRGVNDMIRNYFQLYDAYIQRLRADQGAQQDDSAQISEQALEQDPS